MAFVGRLVANEVNKRSSARHHRRFLGVGGVKVSRKWRRLHGKYNRSWMGRFTGEAAPGVGGGSPPRRHRQRQVDSGPLPDSWPDGKRARGGSGGRRRGTIGPL